MNLATVMTQIAARAATITGLRAFDWPPGKVVPPAAVVGYPDEILFDQTYQRGADRLTVPFVVFVGKSSERAARDALGAYCDGSGARSIKAVLESGTYTAFDSLVVSRADFDIVTNGGVDYIAAIFDLDIVGHGS